MVILFLVATHGSFAGERSFTLQGKTYDLEFPDSFVYKSRIDSGETAYVFFGNSIIDISFGDFPHKKGILPDINDFIKDQTEKGSLFIKAINVGNTYLLGSCHVDTDLTCFYVFQKMLTGNRWLVFSVGCECSAEADRRAAAELAEDLATQLR